VRVKPPPERIWSGDSAGWKGLWCARRRRASSSAAGDGATSGSARRWGVEGGSVAAVQNRRMAVARAVDAAAAGSGGGMAGDDGSGFERTATVCSLWTVKISVQGYGSLSRTAEVSLHENPLAQAPARQASPLAKLQQNVEVQYINISIMMYLILK
jgi:hypothetical protein